MTDKNIRRPLMISFISALLLFSTVTVVFPASAGTSLDHTEDEENGKVDGPPVDIDPDPIVPDPGNMTKKIGGFGEDMGELVGSFVTFETIENGISNHSLTISEDKQLEIFEKISVEEFDKYEERIVGHTFYLEGNGAEFQLYDSPSTMLKLDVHPVEESERNVSFKLGDVNVDQIDKGRIGITNEDYSGNLISIDTSGSDRQPPIERDNFMEVKDGFINFTVEERATFIFKMEMDGFQKETRDFVREGIRRGRIGAEFRIESPDEEGYIHTSFSYRDVDMKAQMRDENTLDMLVSSKTLGDEGTLLLLDISSTVMDISSKEDIDLLFDGKSADFMEDLSEVDESEDPSYTLIHGEEGTHILVNVLEFSTHSITVEYIADVVDQYLGSLTYYIPAATASVGLVIFGLLYKKNDKEEKKKKDRRVSIDKHPKNYEKEKGDVKKIKSSKKDKEKETRVRKD